MDIGCGDGGFSLILREVLESRTYKGVDSHVRLVACARRRGLDARILDVENQDVSGDLGVLWGVLHHLESPVSTLKRISSNFKSLIVRECIDERRVWEIGQNLSKEKLMRILSDAEIGIDRYELLGGKGVRLRYKR